jgi:hypothetical protein
MNLEYQGDKIAKITSPEASKTILYVDKFSDVRGGSDKHLIGEAKTGAFNESTPILIIDDVDEFSMRSFALAFSKAGFVVVDDLNRADIIFKGRINKFWLQEFATGYSPEHYEADIEYDLALIDNHDKKPRWFDIKRIHKKSKVSMTDATDLAQPTMNEALNEAINSVLSDPAFNGAVTDCTGKRD